MLIGIKNRVQIDTLSAVTSKQLHPRDKILHKKKFNRYSIILGKFVNANFFEWIAHTVLSIIKDLLGEERRIDPV